MYANGRGIYKELRQASECNKHNVTLQHFVLISRCKAAICIVDRHEPLWGDYNLISNHCGHLTYTGLFRIKYEKRKTITWTIEPISSWLYLLSDSFKFLHTCVPFLIIYFSHNSIYLYMYFILYFYSWILLDWFYINMYSVFNKNVIHINLTSLFKIKDHFMYR